MPYGDASWKRLAAQVVGGQACVRCGRPAQHAHHILPRAFGGPDDPSNLAPVCGRCHPSLERVARQRALWLGYQPVPAGEPPRRVQARNRGQGFQPPRPAREELADLLVRPDGGA